MTIRSTIQRIFRIINKNVKNPLCSNEPRGFVYLVVTHRTEGGNAEYHHKDDVNDHYHACNDQGGTAIVPAVYIAVLPERPYKI